MDKKTGELLHNTQTPIAMMMQLENLLAADDCPIELDNLFSDCPTGSLNSAQWII